MTDGVAGPSGPSVGRPILKTLRTVAAYGLASIILAGLLGQLTRDRSAALAVLMYLPLLPLGMLAIILDLARSGRALRRGRFALSLLGCLSCLVGAMPMIGRGPVDDGRLQDPRVTLLHWNVQWGGGLFRSPKTWAAQRAAIIAYQPDLVILSEGPSSDEIDLLVQDLGPGASWVGVEHDPRSRYWYKLAVCSRWPIRLERSFPLPRGTGMSVHAEVDGHSMRLLVVDGLSDPFHSRVPFLHAITEACREALETGHPYDAIAGDFNTPSRSIGFDALAGQGYQLASRSTRGWRGTFPALMPVYDIDHVWLAPDIRLRSCTLFNGPSTDHRGQVVRFQPSRRQTPAIARSIRPMTLGGRPSPYRRRRRL